MRSACNSLVRKPKPTSAPATTSQRVRPESIARTVAYPAAVRRSTSSASGSSKRNIRAATGVTATTRPARSPAPGEAHRRTAAYSTATVAMPSRACGTRRLQLLKPKIRANSSITHNDAGGLSTVMKLEASKEPKNIAFQLLVPACTAAE